MGFVYIVHRAGVGATVSDVEIFDRPGFMAEDSLYVDLVNHNPLVAKAEDFQLATGLSYKAPSIREYEIDYKAGGIDLHLDCRALMDPYDIHDPEMDPMAVADSAAAVENSGFGTAYSAHFDMTIAIQGYLRIEGREHKINCVSTMDHSWGGRGRKTGSVRSCGSTRTSARTIACMAFSRSIATHRSAGSTPSSTATR
ncbi:hypothetical protein ACFSTD_17190 [Novosphingobium colocasiae]